MHARSFYPPSPFIQPVGSFYSKTQFRVLRLICKSKEDPLQCSGLSSSQ